MNGRIIVRDAPRGRKASTCRADRLTDDGFCGIYGSMYLFVFAVTIFLLVVLGSLRYSKGITPLRQSGDVPLPGFPGPRGLVIRLDGMERKQRVVTQGNTPSLKKDGSMVLPGKWEGNMTAGRMAAVAHVWGMSLLSEHDPAGVRKRESALPRTIVLTFFAGLIAMALFFVKHVNIQTSLMLVAGTWALLTTLALLSQYKEAKARDLAKKRLKEVGLWPRLPHDRDALETCLDAMIWCRVAGFLRVLPK